VCGGGWRGRRLGGVSRSPRAAAGGGSDGEGQIAGHDLTRAVAPSIFRDKNRRFLGKSQPKRPHKRTRRPAHLPAAAFPPHDLVAAAVVAEDEAPPQHVRELGLGRQLLHAHGSARQHAA
jgi:hypothetical protein